MNHHSTWGHPTKQAKRSRRAYQSIVLIIAAGAALAFAHLAVSAAQNVTAYQIDPAHFCGAC